MKQRRLVKRTTYLFTVKGALKYISSKTIVCDNRENP